MAIDDATDSSPDSSGDDASSGAGYRHFYTGESDTDDTPPHATGPTFPVASTGTDGSNSLPPGLSTLTLWLLNEDGKRMAADPNARDVARQAFGAPYLLTLASGQVCVGYADETGLLTIENVVAAGVATLEWGDTDDAPVRLPYCGDPAPTDQFLYSEEISLDVQPTDDLETTRKASNMGYVGEGADLLAGFAADYGFRCAR